MMPFLQVFIVSYNLDAFGGESVANVNVMANMALSRKHVFQPPSHTQGQWAVAGVVKHAMFLVCALSILT